MIKALAFISTILFWASSAFGGPIVGLVTFSGDAPEPKIIKTGKFRKVCGPEVINGSLTVENKRVMNTVVWLSGKNADKLEGLAKPAKLDQKKCVYEPHVIAMKKGTELEIHSSDPINHNIHTYSFDNDPINLMFLPNQDYSEEFDESEIVRVECDLHAWMQAWIIVLDNSYFGVTDKEGIFKIADVPPGKYTLNTWHETLGNMSKEIEVGESPIQVNFKYKDLPKLSKN